MKRKTPGYRYVEGQLYAYHQLKKEAQNERERIIESGALLEIVSLGVRVQSNNTYDSTQAKGIELVDNKWLTRIEDDLRAIDRVLETLDPVGKRLVQLTYWDRRYTPHGIAEQLHISRRTYFRAKDAIVKAMAYQMGMVKQRCG